MFYIKRTEAREKAIKNKVNADYGKKVQFIKMKECQWNKIRLLVQYESQISKIILKLKISEKELKERLSNGEVYGFA